MRGCAAVVLAGSCRGCCSPPPHATTVPANARAARDRNALRNGMFLSDNGSRLARRVNITGIRARRSPPGLGRSGRARGFEVRPGGWGGRSREADRAGAPGQTCRRRWNARSPATQECSRNRPAAFPRCVPALPAGAGPSSDQFVDVASGTTECFWAPMPSIVQTAVSPARIQRGSARSMFVPAGLPPDTISPGLSVRMFDA